MEVSETKIKKQEEMIDILMEEVKRLKTELVKYELIKELINKESGNFLVEGKEMLKRRGVDLGYTCDGSCITEKQTNQEEKTKTSQCWVCGLKSDKLFERNKGKSSSYLCCVDCYKDIEKDIKRVQDREREVLIQDPIKTDKTFKKQKRTRKGISKQEAMKHSKPSKKKNKVICEDCGGEYLTVNFHSHYARHIK